MSNYENWPYYNQQSQQQQQLQQQQLLSNQTQLNIPNNANIIANSNALSSSDLNSSPNDTAVYAYENCWNRATADVAASLYQNYPNYNLSKGHSNQINQYNNGYFNEASNIIDTASNAAQLSNELNMLSANNNNNNNNTNSSSSSPSIPANFKSNLNDSTNTSSTRTHSANSKATSKVLGNVSIKEESQIGNSKIFYLFFCQF